MSPKTWQTKHLKMFDKYCPLKASKQILSSHLILTCFKSVSLFLSSSILNKKIFLFHLPKYSTHHVYIMNIDFPRILHITSSWNMHVDVSISNNFIPQNCHYLTNLKKKYVGKWVKRADKVDVLITDLYSIASREGFN